MSRFCKYFLGAFLLSNCAFAADLDVLIARTALALGDEYSKVSTKYELELAAILSDNPNALTSDIEDAPTGLTSTKEKFESYKSLALSEYSIVFCEENCPDVIELTGLELPLSYAYLEREAFTKHQMLLNGVNSAGQIGKYSPIYAVNSNFEEHLLGRFTRLVADQQKMDTEARRLTNTLVQLRNGYVENDGEVIGVEQGLLQQSNYSLDAQTQAEGYQSCIETETLTDNFEKSELQSAMAQLETVQKSLKARFDKIYDSVYANAANDKLVTVQANLGWQEQTYVFSANDRILVTATGRWNVKGAITNFQTSHLYVSSKIKDEKGFLDSIKRNIAKVINPIGSAIEAITNIILKPNAKILKSLAADSKPAFNKIRQGMDATPEGYYISFSHGQSTGESSSTSLGISFIGSLGVSDGESSGTSAGTGGSYGIKLTTVAVPSIPVGALIGSFCAGNPDSNEFCEKFYIGAGGVFEVPADIEGKNLWLRANESSAFSANKGSLQVKVQKQSSFLSLYQQFEDWFSDECDSNGYNCGLGHILENIAYIPDPFVTAKTAFDLQFPDFPPEAVTIFHSYINSFVEAQVALKDLKTREHSREINFTKIATCKSQLELTRQKIENTSELVATYARRQQGAETKRALLEAAREFYEVELAGLNNVREKNLDRIKRYYALTIGAYNYLYLDNLKVEESAQRLFEGDFYKTQIDNLEDLILEITAVNDLLNPNRGFVVYDLSPEELASLQNPDYRLRKTQVRLSYNDFFCQGFNLENQSRVMIEKVGVLLDIDPAREHLFFKNSNKRSTQLQLAHGLENRFYGFDGKEHEFWMPAQKRNVAGYSSRILTDANSDYFDLRDARYFERLSFRKTSFATTWQVDMLDPAIRMHEASDVGFTNPILKGAKLVFWFNSAETGGELNLNQCLQSPYDIIATPDEGDVGISFKFDSKDADYSKTEGFSVYRSSAPDKGFRAVGRISLATDCELDDDELLCDWDDTLAPVGTSYYQVRSFYKSQDGQINFLDGIPSEVVSAEITSKKK